MLKNTVGFRGGSLRRGKLGDGLGALGHGVLGQLAGKGQPDRSLDLTGCQRLGLVDLSQFA